MNNEMEFCPKTKILTDKIHNTIKEHFENEDVVDLDILLSSLCYLLSLYLYVFNINRDSVVNNLSKIILIVYDDLENQDKNRVKSLNQENL